MPQDFVALKHLAFFSIGSATRPKNSSFGITVLRAHEFCTILPKSMGVSILFGLALMLMMELEALRIAMFVVNFIRACTCHHQATADSFESCVIQWFMIQPRMYNNTTNPKSLIPHCYHCIFIVASSVLMERYQRRPVVCSQWEWDFGTLTVLNYLVLYPVQWRMLTIFLANGQRGAGHNIGHNQFELYNLRPHEKYENSFSCRFRYLQAILILIGRHSH